MRALAWFVAALALLSSAWTYFYYQKNGREKRRRALQHFKSSKNQAEELQKKLCSLAEKNSSNREPLLDGLTLTDLAAKLGRTIDHFYTTENRQVLESVEVQSREFTSITGRLERERLFMEQVEEIVGNHYED